MSRVTCVHNIAKGGYCSACTALAISRTARYVKQLGVQASEAGTQIGAAFSKVPQKSWDLLDAEIARRKKIKRKKLIYGLSILTVFVILVTLVMIES